METIKSVKSVMSNLNPIAINHKIMHASGVSMSDISIRVLVNTNKEENAMGFEIDIVEDGNGGLEAFFGQFLFNLKDEEHCIRKELQEDQNFAKSMARIAIDYIKEKGLFVDGKINLKGVSL